MFIRPGKQPASLSVYYSLGQPIRYIRQLLYAECRCGKENRTHVGFTQKGSDLRNIPTAVHLFLVARRRKLGTRDWSDWPTAAGRVWAHTALIHILLFLWPLKLNATLLQCFPDWPNYVARPPPCLWNKYCRATGHCKAKNNSILLLFLNVSLLSYQLFICVWEWWGKAGDDRILWAQSEAQTGSQKEKVIKYLSNFSSHQGSICLLWHDWKTETGK